MKFRQKAIKNRSDVLLFEKSVLILQIEMKRTLIILLLCGLFGTASIVALPDSRVSQRIENASSEPSATGGVGRISFYAGNSDAVFSIYSITGQLLRVVRLQADQRQSVDMPKGFYIVRCNNQWSRKVVVK